MSEERIEVVSINGHPIADEKARKNLAALTEENLLHADVIKGTVQTVTFNADGTPAKVIHTATDGTVVRTDTFAYSADKIREVRDTGKKTLNILTNLTSLSVEVN